MMIAWWDMDMGTTCCRWIICYYAGVPAAEEREPSFVLTNGLGKKGSAWRCCRIRVQPG